MPRARKGKGEKVAAARTGKLIAFHDTGLGPNFSFARFKWQGGVLERQSIYPKFDAKMHPGGGNRVEDLAAATHVLLPKDAPQDYASLGFLVRRFEECLPWSETVAFAQLTMKFPDAPNLHAPFETAREWVKAYYVEERQLPVALFLHDPSLVGCENPGHVHALILPRRLNRRGWGGVVRDIANDASRAAAWQSWRQHHEADRDPR